MEVRAFAIQWYDPFMPSSVQPFKDGPPRGNFPNEQAARDAAEKACESEGVEIPYKVVSVSCLR